MAERWHGASQGELTPCVFRDALGEWAYRGVKWGLKGDLREKLKGGLRGLRGVLGFRF